MDADLDTLCTVIYCTADDLLPSPRRNARRRITDAELVTLCVAQAIMGIPSDRRFLAAARRQLGHLFPVLPSQSGYHKRRRRLSGAIEWLMGVFAAQSPGSRDDLLLVDSTPVPCAQSRETVKRSALGEAAGYGYCAGAEFAARAAEQGVLVVRPRRKDEAGEGPHLAPIRQRIESIFWTCKDLLTLERHGARTLAGLRERVLSRFLCLAACISLNHRLGRPSRALVDYCA